MDIELTIVRHGPFPQRSQLIRSAIRDSDGGRRYRDSGIFPLGFDSLRFGKAVVETLAETLGNRIRVAYGESRHAASHSAVPNGGEYPIDGTLVQMSEMIVCGRGHAPTDQIENGR